MKKHFSNALFYTVQACIWISVVILRLNTIGYFPAPGVVDSTVGKIDLWAFFLQFGGAVFSVVSAVVYWVRYGKEKAHGDS